MFIYYIVLYSIRVFSSYIYKMLLLKVTYKWYRIQFEPSRPNSGNLWRRKKSWGLNSDDAVQFGYEKNPWKTVGKQTKSWRCTQPSGYSLGFLSLFFSLHHAHDVFSHRIVRASHDLRESCCPSIWTGCNWVSRAAERGVRNALDSIVNLTDK